MYNEYKAEPPTLEKMLKLLELVWMHEQTQWPVTRKQFYNFEI